MKTTLSKRKYRVYTTVDMEGEGVPRDKSLSQILDDDIMEETYALQEHVDPILDLAVGESLCFLPNRDCGRHKGLILRIQ